MKRVKTGLKKLDSLMEGGLPSDTVTLVSGSPGTGKTLMALNFLLEGAKQREKCCYVSLNEKKKDLLRAAEGISQLAPLKKYLGKNLAIETIELGENITMKKFVEIVSSYPKIDRLVIDDVNKLLMFAESRRNYRLQLSELVRHLRQDMGCALLLCEAHSDKIDTGNGEAFETDGVIHLSFLDLEEKPIRTLQIHKLRYTQFEPRVSHKLNINRKTLSLDKTKVI